MFQSPEEMQAEIGKLANSQRKKMREIYQQRPLSRIKVEKRGWLTKVDFTSYGVRRIVTLGPRGAVQDIEHLGEVA